MNRRLLGLLATAAIAALLPLAPAFGADEALSVVSTDVTAWPDVRLVIAAPAQLGDQVLTDASFRVTEGGESRPVSRVEALGTDQLEVALVLDTSGSMLESLEGRRRIDIAKNVLGELVAETLAPGTVGAPKVSPASEPTASTSWKVMVAPVSASSFSTFSTLLGVTRYCLPPVRITAKVIVGPEWWSCRSRGWRRHRPARPGMVVDGRAEPTAGSAAKAGDIDAGREGRQRRRVAPRRPPSYIAATQAAERCRSGRSGRSRKPKYGQPYRGFESHPLRQYVEFPKELLGIRGRSRLC